MAYQTLVVECGLRKPTDRSLFALPTGNFYTNRERDVYYKPTPTELKNRLEEQFKQLSKNSDQKSMNIVEAFKVYQVFISTSEEDDPELGLEADWKEYEFVEEAEMTSLIKRCVRQGRPLRTACFPKSELNWLWRKNEEILLKREEERVKHEQVSVFTLLSSFCRLFSVSENCFFVFLQTLELGWPTLVYCFLPRSNSWSLFSDSFLQATILKSLWHHQRLELNLLPIPVRDLESRLDDYSNEH